jgi:hypothetical protein
MKELTANTLEQQYPSVELAYPFAAAAYEVAQKRLDAVDSKLQTLMAVGVSLSLAVPAIVVSRGVRFASVWFIAACVFFLLAICIGLYARVTGDLRVINPMRIYNHMLHLSVSDFKVEAVYWAGKDFETNRDMIERKAKLGTYALIAFLIESALVVVWVCLARS